MSALLNIPLRYLLPGVVALAAIVAATVPYLTSRPVVLNELQSLELNSLNARLNQTQAILKLLLREDRMNDVRRAIAATNATPGHELTLYADENNVVQAATRLSAVGQSLRELDEGIDTATTAKLATLPTIDTRAHINGHSVEGYAPVCVASDSLGASRCGLLYQRIDLQRQNATALHALRNQAIEHAITIFILALVLGVLLHYIVTRRTQKIVTATRRFTSGDTSARVRLKGKDELALGAKAIDAMLETIVSDNERLRLLDRAIMSSRDPVLMTNPRQEDNPLVFVNPAFSDVTGYSSAEALGRNCRFLQGEDNEQAGLDDIRQAIAEERGCRTELRNYKKDGSLFWISLNIAPVHDDEGYLSHFVGIQTDITISKQNEQALKENQTMLEKRVRQRTQELTNANDELREATRTARHANKVKTRFLAAVSHDLRQPLQSIGMYLGVMSHTLVQEKNKDVASNIRKSVDAMGEQLNTLLDLSRLESGAIQPAISNFCIQDLLEEIKSEATPHATQKGLTLKLLPSSCMVSSDRALCRRIIENLVFNAIKYTHEGRVVIGCRRRDDIIRIEVWDTGIGIKPEDLKGIFEEYVQLQNPEQNHAKGVGLGLAMVNQLCQLLDHKINVHSTVGKGSVFRVHLPRSESVKPVQSDETTPQEQSQRINHEKTVLYIEDDPVVQNATRMLLEIEGYRVITVESGDQAIRQVDQEKLTPDLILSDYRLTGNETGMQVVTRVLEKLEQQTPVVFMTGETGATLLNETGDFPYEVMHKPIDADRLIGLMDKLCNRIL